MVTLRSLDLFTMFFSAFAGNLTYMNVLYESYHSFA